MIMGGIEKALLSMVEYLPKDQFEVTVLVMGSGGELETEFPPHVKVRNLFGEEQSTIEKIVKHAKNGKLVDACKTFYYTVQSKKAKTVYEQELNYSKMLPVLNDQYDLAIAYHTPASFPVVYVMNNIKAKVKAAWIHSDVMQYVKELRSYAHYYEKYDQVYCVSKEAKERFIELYPHLAKKTSLFYNLIDDRKLHKLSEVGEGYKDDFKGLRILTVGRLTSQKGQDIIPVILKKLLSDGFNLRWYCVGEGEDRSHLESLIKQHQLEDNFKLLGNQANPYPFINECDIYVQPSRHEGYCITLAEARAFHKPILTTNFTGAREQIEHGKNGLIVEFEDNEIYKSLKNLLEDNELKSRLTNNLKQKNVNTLTEIENLYTIIG
jgi:glycosyltransferase involved in cell wall biosynthesis